MNEDEKVKKRWTFFILKLYMEKKENGLPIIQIHLHHINVTKYIEMCHIILYNYFRKINKMFRSVQIYKHFFFYLVKPNGVSMKWLSWSKILWKDEEKKKYRNEKKELKKGKSIRKEILWMTWTQNCANSLVFCCRIRYWKAIKLQLIAWYICFEW